MRTNNRYVGNVQSQIELPSKHAIRRIIAEHALVGFKGSVKRAFLVGSFAAGNPHPQSDVDILFEVSTRKGLSAEELTEKYREPLRKHFLVNNIRGKADHLHPQWCGRRVDLYFTYNAQEDTRPRIKLR